MPLVISLPALSIAVATALGTPADPPAWHPSWNAALENAKSRETIVMAEVYTDWCKWCKVLDRETFGDGRVKKSLAEMAIVKVNAEKGEGVELRKQFSVSGFPTLLFLDSGGGEIDRISGFIKPEPFLIRLTEIRRGENTFGDLLSRSKTEPADLGISKLLADKYMERGNSAEAMKRYDEILAGDPEDRLGFAASIHLVRARGLLSSGDRAAARGSLEKVTELDDRDALRDAYPVLRRIYLMDERPADVDRLHDRVVASLPDNPQVLNDIAWYYASRSERLDQALAWARRGVELAPGDGSILDTLAEVHHRRGEHESAIATIERAVRIDPQSDYLQKQLTRFKSAANPS